MCCYADDSTYTASGLDPNQLSQQISDKYRQISHYMKNNLLVLNSDKTHLMVLASPHKHRKHGDFSITLDTGNEIITPQDSGELLGITLSNNFRWNQHIRDGESSLMSILSKKNNALAKVAKIASFKTRLMIGNGLIMSTLTYAIQIYGACSSYLIHMLQVQQNAAARHITQLPWMTPTSTLLKQCNWLSIRQMISYHSLVLLQKVVACGQPKVIFRRMSPPERETRNSDNLTLQDSRSYRTATAEKTFIHRVISDWNALPLELRNSSSQEQFNSKLRLFIREKIFLNRGLVVTN